MTKHKAIQSKNHIDSLTGLRAFAALWVVFHNMNRYHDGVDPGFVYKIDWGWAEAIIQFGYQGVDIFFFLSGFVISYVYQHRFVENLSRDEIIKFYKLRLGRIYPLHFAILMLIILLSVNYIFPYDLNIRPYPTFLNLTLMDSWGLYKGGSWNAPAWSLSAEWFMYVLYPFIAFMVIRNRGVKYYVVLLLTISLTYFILSMECCTTTEIDDGVGGVIRVVFGFLAGSILYNFYRLSVLKKMPWDVIGISAFFLLFYSQRAYRDDGDLVNVLAFLCFAIIVYALVNSKYILKFIFANMVSKYLGKISFAIFLLHMPVMKILGDLFRGEFNHLANNASQQELILYLFVCMGVLLVASSFCYHFIENPCRNYVKRRVDSVVDNGSG